MENKGNVLLIVSLVLFGFALLFCVIGFSTSHWLELDSRYVTSSSFENLGLWEACFKNFAFLRDYTGKLYNGCWWIFSEEYRPVWDYINPPWFLGIQVMMTIVLIAEVLTVLMSILFLIKCCRGGDNMIALFVLGSIAIAAGILTGISTIIFGAKTVTDTHWIQEPEKNFLSWSFGCVVFSGFMELFGGVCSIVAALYVKLQRRYTTDRPMAYRPQPKKY